VSGIQSSCAQSRVCKGVSVPFTLSYAQVLDQPAAHTARIVEVDPI